MPIYEYQAKQKEKSCDYCAERFEIMQKIADQSLDKCPKCSAPLIKIFSAPAIGSSKSSIDNRAKAAGFHKLQKLGKGEYEKKY